MGVLTEKMEAMPRTEIDLVIFMAAGQTFAVESTKVRALRLAEDMGAPSIAALLGLSPHTDALIAPRQWLLHLVHPDGTLTVGVDSPVTQNRLSITALHPLPFLLEARLTLPAIRALACWRNPDGEKFAVVLDPAYLPIG